MKKKKSRKLIYNVLLLIVGAVFVFSAYQVGKTLYQYYLQDKEAEQMQEIAKVPKDPEEKEFKIDWNELKKTNEDIIGWILIPDTNLSHAIVQGTDNSYYLNHTVEKRILYSGAIFMDYAANPDFQDRHTIIYGHNVKYGTMFAQLDRYREKDFYETHPYVYIFTPEKSYRCPLVSFEHTNDTSPSYQTQFASDEEYAQYLDKVKAASIYDTGVEIGVEDQLITLSTCSYERGGQPSELRYLVHLKLEEYDGKYIIEE